MFRKSLIVICDGTGIDGLLTNPPANQDMKDVQYTTNPLRLSRAVLPQREGAGETVAQIVFYQSGVGSSTDFEGDEGLDNALLQGYGDVVASKIRDAYAFIAQNYAPGDDICIFGFSRGAYTARKVGGLINRIGLLSRKQMANFFSIWLELLKGTQPGPPRPEKPVPIQCIGVFDTVGSVFEGDQLVPRPIVDALNIKDNSLPPNVKVALHAVSLQENREKFNCTLWRIDPNQKPLFGQVMKQQFFPGAHSDVGGGYKRHELADLSFFWMVGEISSFIALDLDYVRDSHQPNPDAPWGQTQPHNTFEEADLGKKILYGHLDRLKGGAVFRDSVFHSSLQVAPTKLNNPKGMITMADVQKAFGAQWTPTYAPLNPFEKLCKDQWKTIGLQTGESAPLDMPGRFMQRILTADR